MLSDHERIILHSVTNTPTPLQYGGGGVSRFGGLKIIGADGQRDSIFFLSWSFVIPKHFTFDNNGSPSHYSTSPRRD